MGQKGLAVLARFGNRGVGPPPYFCAKVAGFHFLTQK
jgi:hypothetical protein